ncbi:MAG: DUF4783 domain-containing protein [Cyclobacteriaceae bacterium]
MKTLLYTFLFTLLISFTNGEIMDDTKLAINSSNATELVKLFTSVVELRTDEEEGTYSKTQAELVLKTFFKKHTSTSFSYIHKGSSPGGAKYVIGNYKYSGGEFRVYVKMKLTAGKYYIDTIDFSKDE